MVVGVGGCGGVGVGVGVMGVDLFLGGRDISMKGAPDFQALLKKDQKLNKKKQVFFQLKVRSNINI